MQKYKLSFGQPESAFMVLGCLIHNSDIYLHTGKNHAVCCTHEEGNLDNLVAQIADPNHADWVYLSITYKPVSQGSNALTGRSKEFIVRGELVTDSLISMISEQLGCSAKKKRL